MHLFYLLFYNGYLIGLLFTESGQQAQKFGNHATVHRPTLRPHHTTPQAYQFLKNSINRYGNPNVTRGYFGAKSHSHMLVSCKRTELQNKRGFSRFSSERSGNGARDTRDWGRRRKNNVSFFLRLLASRVSNTPPALDFTRHKKANKKACSAGYNQYRATRRNRGELAPADS